jgi:hypothetical protein
MSSLNHVTTQVNRGVRRQAAGYSLQALSGF